MLSSSDTSCLVSSQAVSVVTTTATVAATTSTTRQENIGASAETTTLRILCIILGLLLLTCIGTALYLYSLLRRRRKWFTGSARFDLGDDISSFSSATRTANSFIGEPSDASDFVFGGNGQIGRDIGKDEEKPPQSPETMRSGCVLA